MVSGVTLESLHDDLVALRRDIERLEAKIDEKPSRWVMFTALAVTVLVMVAAVGGALAILDALGS